MSHNKTSVSKALVAGLVVALTSVPYVVNAQDNLQPRWYGGISGGYADVGERNLDDDDFAFKLFGGYRFNEFFAAEAAYVDIGELKDDFISATGARNTLDTNSVSVGGVGRYPLNESFAIHGKIGLHYWDADVEGPLRVQVDDDNDTDLYYGAGLSYDFGNNIGLIGEWERYEVDDFDIDLVSVGVTIQF